MTSFLFCVFFLFLIMGVPIAISLGVASICTLLVGTHMPLLILPQKIYNGVNSFPYMAIPLFLLAGNIMAEAKISERLVALAQLFVGRFPGGLAHVSTGACAFFGAISGSAPATTAAIGTIMIPSMEKRGYNKAFSAAVVAASGALGLIIPPSLTMVVFGVMSGASIGTLFLCGIIPGILISLVIMLVNYVIAKKKGLVSEKPIPLSEAGHILRESILALLMPFIILGGIYSGIVTPTEAACVSVFYALFVSLVVYRSITLKDLIPFLASSVKTYGGLAFVLAFATAFGRVLSLTRATKVIEDFIVGNFTTSWSVLSVLVILFLILGMVMDTGPAIVILAPILLPAVQALGVDSVHFGVILVCCLSIGLATPPFGLDLFVAGNLAEEPPMAVAKRAVPFIIAFLLALALITYVEPVSLALLGR